MYVSALYVEVAVRTKILSKKFGIRLLTSFRYFKYTILVLNKIRNHRKMKKASLISYEHKNNGPIYIGYFNKTY